MPFVGEVMLVLFGADDTHQRASRVLIDEFDVFLAH